MANGFLGDKISFLPKPYRHFKAALKTACKLIGPHLVPLNIKAMEVSRIKAFNNYMNCFIPKLLFELEEIYKDIQAGYHPGAAHNGR